MSRNDPIADALINIKNSDYASKKNCVIRPASKLLGEILKIMKEKNYIGDYTKIDDGREGIFEVKLFGKINECRVIKLRYAVGKDGYEKYEKRYLPAHDIGTIIVTTPKGVLSHIKAKAEKTGGRLLAYIY